MEQVKNILQKSSELVATPWKYIYRFRRLIICLIGLIVAACLLGAAQDVSVPGKYISSYGGYTEYVGGDAYNFIIEAGLRGGQISGAKAQQAIYYAAAAIVFMMSLAVLAMGGKESAEPAVKDEPAAVLPGLEAEPAPQQEAEAPKRSRRRAAPAEETAQVAAPTEEAPVEEVPAQQPVVAQPLILEAVPLEDMPEETSEQE